MSPRRVSPLQAALQNAAEALQANRLPEAQALLEPLRLRAPQEPEVLRLLVDLYRRLDRSKDVRLTLEALVALAPSPSVRRLLGLVYLQQGYPYRGFDLLARTPEWVTDDLQEMRLKLEADLPPQGGWALRRAQEDVRLLIEQDSLNEALKRARRVLQEWPEDTWTLGAAAQLEWREEALDKALTHARHLQAIDPGNLQALTVTIRCLSMQGDLEAAAPYATTMKTLPDDSSRTVFEKLRAWSYVGDWLNILDTYGHYVPGADQGLEDEVGIQVWSGVAAIALGRPDIGQQLLEKACEQHSGWSLLNDNLDDLRRPAAAQEGPFALRLSDWLGERFVATHAGTLQRVLQAPAEATRTEAALALHQAHPHLDRLLPVLLERSDPPARQLAVEVAKATGQTDILRQFALGRAGTDAGRWAVVRWLKQRGLLSEPALPMWIKGEQRPIRLFDFDLRDDPPVEYRRPISEWVAEALEAYQEGRFGTAEGLLHRALERQPDSVDLQLDLATVLLRQGRIEAAEELLQGVSAEVGRAIALRLEVYLAQGRLAAAEAMLVPSLSRRWHRSDFARFCDASLRLNLARGQAEENAAVRDARRLAVPDETEVPWSL